MKHLTTKLAWVFLLAAACTAGRAQDSHSTHDEELPGAVADLTPSEAVRKAKNFLDYFINVSDLIGPNGEDEESQFLGLFALNASLPDDVNGSDELIAPLRYAQNMRERFPTNPPEMETQLREELTSFKWVPTGEYFEVTLVFRKTMSKHFFEGREAGKYTQYHRFIINIYENGMEKITGISIFYPGAPTAIEIGAAPGVIRVNNRYTSFDDLGGMDNTIDFSGSARVRVHFNPFPAANVTQRKGLRFTAGLDVLYHRGTASSDSIVYTSPSSEAISTIDGIEAFQGRMTSTIRNVETAEQQIWGVGVAGVNMQLFKSGNRSLMLNAGVGANARLWGNYKLELSGDKVFELDDSDLPEHDMGNIVFDASATRDSVFAQVGENWTKSFDSYNDDRSLSTFVYVNPTFAIRKNSWLQWTIGVEGRFPLLTADALDLPYLGTPEQISSGGESFDDVPWSLLYSKRLRMSWFSVTVGVSFGSKEK